MLQELRENPLNYDTWFSYVRLEESGGDLDRIRDVCLLSHHLLCVHFSDVCARAVLMSSDSSPLCSTAAVCLSVFCVRPLAGFSVRG